MSEDKDSLKKSSTNISKYLKKYSKEILLWLVLIISIINIAFSFYIFSHSNQKTIVYKNHPVEKIDGKKIPNKEHTGYGTKSEVYSKYENGKWNTYSNNQPMTKEELEDVRKEFNERQKAMNNYFIKQRQLMDEMWNSFLW